MPITITSNNIFVTSDWHIPFVNTDLVEHLLWAAKEYGVEDLAISGDLWDCDNLSHYTKLTNTMTFDDECKEVGKVLTTLTHHFKRIYISRGNHEKRWLDILGGRTTIRLLYNMSGVPGGYEITLDDHMHLVQQGETWLLCHPRNYRQTPLSVVRDLAAIHQMHVIGGHGHQFSQGVDRSGKYLVCDGGGMFDKEALDYLRETTTHPETRPGFYLLQDNTPMAFELRGVA